MKKLILQWQLRMQGASAAEAKRMAHVAKAVGKDAPALSAEAKKRIAEDIGFSARKPIVTPRLAFASAFALLIVLVVVAQAAKPGQVLYSVKRGTEHVRAIVQPGYNLPDPVNDTTGSGGNGDDDAFDDKGGLRTSDDSDDSKDDANDDSRNRSGGDNTKTEDSNDDSNDSSELPDDSNEDNSGSSNSGSGSGSSGGGHGSDD